MPDADAIYVDPEIAVILREIEEAGLPPASSLPVEVARVQMEERNQALNQDPPKLASVTDLEMPGPGGPIRLRHYRPSTAATLPLVIYFHGGGFVLGSLDTHDRLMRLLALDSGAALIGVDYRLAPEHPLPAGLDDCVAAIGWIRAAAQRLGVDPERVVLAGDSAGANLALASLLDLRDAGAAPCQGAALLYGCYWRRLDTASHAKFGDGSWRLGTAEMRWFWQHYLGDRAIARPARRADPCRPCRPAAAVRDRRRPRSPGRRYDGARPPARGSRRRPSARDLSRRGARLHADDRALRRRARRGARCRPGDPQDAGLV